MDDYRKILIEDARCYQNCARYTANAFRLAMLIGDTTLAIDEQERARMWADKAQRELTYLLASARLA